MAKKIEKDRVRVIKIGKDALYEFIYEKMIEGQADFLGVNPTAVSDHFAINWETGEFLFCAADTDTAFPQELDLQALLRKIPDTADSMFQPNRYREYTVDELKAVLTQKPEESDNGI